MSTSQADPAQVAAAVDIARSAGALALGRFRTLELAVEAKLDGSPVTAADLDAETLVRDRLAEAFPDDAILGEEHGRRAGTSGRTWLSTLSTAPRRSPGECLFGARSWR